MSEPSALPRAREKKRPGRGRKIAIGIVAAVVLLAIIGAAIGEDEQAADTASAPTAESTEVELTLEASRQGDDLQITGTANLPDGAIISWEANDTDGIWVDDGQAEVKDGEFQTASKDMLCDWDTTRDPYVPDGPFEVWASFMLAGDTIPQPAELLERFGEWGEKMTGPQVVDLAGDTAGRRAECVVTVD